MRIALVIEAPTVQHLDRDLFSQHQLRDMVTRLGVEKAYLDIYRGVDNLNRSVTDALEIGTDVIQRAVGCCRSMDLTVAGTVAAGTCTEGVEDPGLGPDGQVVPGRACLSSPRTHQAYEGMLSRLASVVDEVLLDDLIYHWCFCDRCRGRFNELTKCDLTLEQLASRLAEGDRETVLGWTRMTGRNMSELCKRMVAAARSVNPDIQFNAKLLLGNHEHPFFGQTPEAWGCFDRIAVGVENRDGLRPGGGFCNYRYAQAFFGSKVFAAWVDPLNGWDWSLPTAKRQYLEQLRSAVLAGPEELILFSFTELQFTHFGGLVNLLEQHLPTLKALPSQIGRPRTITQRRTDEFADIHSTEVYLNQHLFSHGVTMDYRPLAESSEDPVEVVGVYSHGVDLSALLDAGKTVLVTSEGIRHLVEAGHAELLGLAGKEPLLRDVDMVDYFEEPDGRMVQMSYTNHMRVMAPLGPVCAAGDADVRLWAVRRGARWPALFERKHGHGRVISTCLTLLPEYLHTAYPPLARAVWREVAAEQLGFKLVKHDGRLPPIALIVAERGVVLWNLEPYHVRTRLQYHADIDSGELGFDRRFKIETVDEGWFEARTVLAPDELLVVPRT